MAQRDEPFGKNDLKLIDNLASEISQLLESANEDGTEGL